MKKSSFLALAVAPLILGAPMAAQAQSVTTDPVGFVKTSAPSGYTAVGINMLKPAEFSGLVTAVDGDTITLSAEPNLDSGPHYVEVADGTLEGDRVDIASVSGDVVTLDLAASHNTIATNAIEVGSRIVIREHITLADITEMAGADNLHTGLDVADTDQILTFEGGGFRINAYFDGSWYDAGDFSNVDGKIIAPGTGFLFRNQGGNEIELTTLGEVRTNDFVLPLSAGMQMVTFGYPLDASPSDYALTTDFFTGAEAEVAEGDQILTFEGGGFQIHALFTDNNWYAAGDFANVTNENLFTANNAVIIKRFDADPDFRINQPY